MHDRNTAPLEAWADALRTALLQVVRHVNRPEVDAQIIAEAGVQLDRALFPVLSRVGVDTPVSVVELGDALGKDHSTISRQVAKLESLGLVRRRPAPQDGRVRLLEPTARGAEMLARISQARRAMLIDRFEDWSPQDRDQLLTLLQRSVEDPRPLARSHASGHRDPGA